MEGAPPVNICFMQMSWLVNSARIFFCTSILQPAYPEDTVSPARQFICYMLLTYSCFLIEIISTWFKMNKWNNFFKKIASNLVRAFLSSITWRCLMIPNVGINIKISSCTHCGPLFLWQLNDSYMKWLLSEVGFIFIRNPPSPRKVSS